MRAELREEFDRLRGELFRRGATKAHVADLKAWVVAISLVVVLNLFGTAGVIVTVILTR